MAVREREREKKKRTELTLHNKNQHKRDLSTHSFIKKSSLQSGRLVIMYTTSSSLHSLHLTAFCINTAPEQASTHQRKKERNNNINKNNKKNSTDESTTCFVPVGHATILGCVHVCIVVHLLCIAGSLSLCLVLSLLWSLTTVLHTVSRFHVQIL